MTLIEFRIENDKNIVDFFSLPNNEKKKVIELGLLFMKEGGDRVRLWQNGEWQAKLSALEERLEKEKHICQEVIRNKDREFKNAIDTIKLAEKCVYEKEIEALREKVSCYETRSLQHTDRYNELHSQLSEKFYKREMEIEERTLKSVRGLEKKLELEAIKTARLMNINENSSLKGKEGEIKMESKLNMIFPTAEISDVHKEGHRGDFILRDGDFVMMVENKSHNKSNVQKKDIEKLYSDCKDERNNDIQCAIMTALYTGISNREDWAFEVVNGKPVIFLHNVSSNWENIRLAVKFLKLVVSHKNMDLESVEVQGRFKNVAKIIKRNSKKQMKLLDKYCSEQKDCIALMEEHIIELFGLVSVKF